MVDPALPLPGLSPIDGKGIVARFDGGRLSSDGGLLVLREIERRLAIADRLAACIDDPRHPHGTVHTLADIIRFRLLMIAAGYEDGNDAKGLRLDPIFKMAFERLPSDRGLCSQSTISRLENLPDIRSLLASAVPWSISTARRSGRCRGGSPSTSTTPSMQCMAAGNCGCSMPITTTTAFSRSSSSTPTAASSPPCCARRSGRRAMRSAPFGDAWCARSAATGRVEILVRADSHYACPEVLDWCEANGIDHLFGLAPTSTWKRHVGGLEASTAARFRADPSDGKVRRFKEFFDAAGSWSRVRRIVARVEAGGDGTDTRFIVTNLGHGSGRSLHQELYCRRGQADHIKAWKTHLAADRTSCPKATANQFRLFLHAGAYWLLFSLRALMPRRSSWRVAPFDTLRLRLVKIAARVVEPKTKIKVHLPTSAPDQSIFHLVLGRLPRLVTRQLGQCAPSLRPSTSSAYPPTNLPPRRSGNRSARQ